MIRVMKKILALIFAVVASRAFADVLVLVLDKELDIPLEGVRISVQGSDRSYTTDAEGEASIQLPDPGARSVITARLLGYKPITATIPVGVARIELRMSLEGDTIEGEGLVVEGKKPRKTDAQAGLSRVVTSKDIQARTIGIMEDALSAIKSLPGVGYTGSFNSKPSINGGDPDETVATLDGVYVLFPYQWAGTYTIFDPHLVDSIKLSTGIIGAPYGQVLSGLLEVSSKTTADSDPHLDFGLSTTGLDLFYQQAFGDKAGVLLGGKITWMELPLAMIGQQDLFDADPYVRNGTAKLYWNPAPTVKWALNAHIDTDGVSVSTEDFTAHLYEKQIILSATLQTLVDKNLLWNQLVSYNSFYSETGLDEPASSGASTIADERRYQASTRFDWTPAENHVVSFGLDELWENWSKSDVDNGTTWYDLEGKNTLASGAYIDDVFSLIPGVLTAEAGLRVDHAVVFGGGGMLETYPVANPRARFTYGFLKDLGPIESIDLNGGTGLYSQFPADDPHMDTRYGAASLDIGPTRAWINVLGFDANGAAGETFSVQGYAKHYTSRFYIASGPSGVELMNDGTGYAYGLNVGFTKPTTFWDLSLSYSFSYTKLHNPGGAGLHATSWTAPLGAWYFPYYESFHTIYANFTLKPGDSFAILAQGNVVSGSPTESGTWSDWRFPVNVKFDWHGFYPGSKVRWEFYVGCEDVFALLYSVPLNTAETGVSFDVGYPIPSLGYKLTY